MSHPDSGWEKLAGILNEHPHIVCHTTGLTYHHPDDLIGLTSRLHKQDNALAVWADVILHNHHFTCRALAKCCKYIYWSQTKEGFRYVGLKQWYRRTGGLWNPSLDERDSLFAAIFG